MRYAIIVSGVTTLLILIGACAPGVLGAESAAPAFECEQARGNGPVAWRGLRFGMNMCTVAHVLASDDDIRLCAINSRRERTAESFYQCLDGILGGASVSIGGPSYSVSFGFVDDRLYRVDFRGPTHAPALNSPATAQAYDLRGIVMGLRGAPDRSAAPTTTPARHTWSYTWTGDDGVNYFVGVGESSPYRNYAAMRIEWDEMVPLALEAIAHEERVRLQDAIDNF